MASLTSDLLESSSDTNNIPSLPRRKSSINSQGLLSPIGPVESELNASKISQDDNRLSKKREVYRFQSEWLVSSVAWANEPRDSFRLALASYMEEYSNRVQIVSLSKDDYNEEIVSLNSFEHPYPATKIMWIPRSNTNSQLPHLLATSADYLRIWRIEDYNSSGGSSEQHSNYACNSALVDDSETRELVDVDLQCLLNSNKSFKTCAPLTSFDWNDIDPRIIVTSSVDATCAVWDIEVSKMVDNDSGLYNLKKTIVAHDHEVYDVSFSRSGTGRDVFVSAGGDGSIRLFDLRRLSTSTMLYETERLLNSKDRRALVRVCCNKQDANYVSAFATNSKDILIIDIRQPGKSVVELNSHTADVNSMSWAPHSAHHICTASDDHQALIWELSKLPSNIEEPLLAYRANGKINAISWSASHSDWIAIGFENYLELLRV